MLEYETRFQFSPCPLGPLADGNENLESFLCINKPSGLGTLHKYKNI